MSRLRVYASWLWWSLTAWSLRDTPGWVVMAEDDDGDWHAMSQGDAYGMDYTSGRFPSRETARVYCAWRGLRWGEQRLYVIHERMLQQKLPSAY